MLKEEKLSKVKNKATSKDMVQDGNLMNHKLDVLSMESKVKKKITKVRGHHKKEQKQLHLQDWN